MKHALLAIALLAAFAHAADPTASGRVVTMNMKGIISAATLDRFAAAAGTIGGDPFPAGLIVVLDSPGGDGIAAMHIGRLVRAHKAHVFVQGHCSSACIFILAAGVVRSAPDGAVGIHRGTLMQFKSGVGSVPADLSREGAREAFEAAERQVAAYFAEMRMPAGLFRAMQSVPYEGMRMLSRAEAQGLGLVGVDADYARERAAEGRARFGFDDGTFASRTLSAQDACPVFDPPKAFIDCYVHALQGNAAR